MLWHSEVIGDFLKTIFSLVQEGGHFLAKTDMYRSCCRLWRCSLKKVPQSTALLNKRLWHRCFSMGFVNRTTVVAVSICMRRSSRTQFRIKKEREITK